MVLSTADSIPSTAVGTISGIPVRNIWLLMLYASQLFRQLNQGTYAGIEENPDEIPDLVAEVLAHAVERRMKRNLTYGYQTEHAVLNRVRGRIDILETETRQLLSRGAVACRYERLTVDTPRNQLIRAALDIVARLVRRHELARRCRTLSICLDRLGVAKRLPSRTEISTMRFSRHDADDRYMVEAAKLALDLALPTEAAGDAAIRSAERTDEWVRKLYEKAVGGFYDVVLAPLGWRVDMGRYIKWPVTQKTPGLDDILPAMQTDIVLESKAEGRRIVIDTKFTSVLTSNQFGKEILKSGYLYQIYTYLRSQEDVDDPLSGSAEGILLHPAIDKTVDETAVIQGHPIRFATVDLAASACEIRSRLLLLAQDGVTVAHQ